MEEITARDISFTVGFTVTDNGFVVSATANAPFDGDRQAQRIANELDVVGTRAKENVDTYANVLSRMSALTSEARDDIQNFLSEWNTEAAGNGDIEAFKTAFLATRTA